MSEGADRIDPRPAPSWADRLRARTERTGAEADRPAPPREEEDEPYLEFQSVSKTYDGQTLAVADLDCKVRKGEFLTFLGPSGSGKTTALMMLAGFEAPSAGDIRLNGQSISRMPPHRRDMGVVFQNYALFPHLSVADNVAFPLRARKVPADAIRQKVDQALKLVRLTGYEGRRPLQLSGGQQQRVALARALVFDPALVLMDEPLGALDRQLREQLQHEIKAIQASLGLTVIYVTHDQSEALTMSDRIAVFNAGEIQQIATPEELYERPASAFVASFVGVSNRLKGVVFAVEGDRCVVRTDGGRMVRAELVGEGVCGSRATLTLRPEKVAIDPRGEERQNVIEARVEELVYHGDHTRVRLGLGVDGAFTVRLTHSASGANLKAGETVTIGWRAADCRAFTGPLPTPASLTDAGILKRSLG
jgi:putative spermidine/putrescine transport system ATP-binding protein